jgi:1-phosphofructokinase family hexose kinase
VGGWSGAVIRDEFNERKIAATWIATRTATRVCTTLLLDGAPTTELVENAEPIAVSDCAAFIRTYQGLCARAEFVVITGSLPKGTPAGFYRDLLANTNCPVVLDARGPELLQALELKPRVVKPNREELALTVGRLLPDRDAVVSAMRELRQRGAQGVVVTAGKETVLILEGDHIDELTPPTVTPVVNPIGCGDCLAAGVAMGLARGGSLVDAVRFGMAAAADNVTQLLPARLSRQRVESLCANIK